MRSPISWCPISQYLRGLIVASLLACTSLPGSARADDYFSDGRKELVYRSPGERSRKEKIVVLSLAGASVLTGSIGLYFALDSRSLSNELSATRAHTNLAWTPERDQKYDDSQRSRRIAQIGLGISGAAALAGVIAYIVTAPDDKIGYQNWQANVVPTKDGFVLGSGWQF